MEVAAASEDGLEIRVLGPVEVVRAGRVLEIGGRRQRALLALLVQAPGRAVRADQLIEELWAGEPPDAAAVTIRSYVSRLRSAIGDATPIQASAAGYSIDVDATAVDVARFERLLGDGRRLLERRNPVRAAEALAEALALWRGPAFGDLGDEGALRAEADRLLELRLEALELRIEADLALGRAHAVIDELEGLLAEHPYREAFWRQLMLALYRSERQADALAAFHRARRTLDEDLGLEPGEDLAALELDILNHRVRRVTPPEARTNLPAPLTSFIGRMAEIAVVREALGTSRLVTLTGLGGVGKTRLALEAARATAEDYVDGVYFVDLATIVEPDLVAREIAAAIEVAQEAGRPLPELLADRLRDRDMLLVLDNAEHVLAMAARVSSEILEPNPGLRILATSREPLGVPGEAVYPLSPLSLAAGATTGNGVTTRNGPSDAVELFLARARLARPALPLTALTIATAERICADLDGLPLAIELAAARAQTLSTTEIAARLADRFKFLVSTRGSTQARHRTLREAMDWSYDLLAPDEQAAFARLSVFVGGFTLAAAAAVIETDEDRVLATIERLVNASLLVPDHQHGETTRYHEIETVRQYATGRLGERDELVDARSRHADFFLALAEARTAQVERELPLDPLMELDGDVANLRAALVELESVGEHELVLRLSVALWRYWWLRGHLVEGRERLTRALVNSASVDTLVRLRALCGTSTLAARQGDTAAAVAFAEDALAMARRLGIAEGLVQALMAAGNAISEFGDLDRAYALYSEATDVLRGSPHDRNLAVLLLNMGDLALTRGDLDGAERSSRESLALCLGSGDDAGAAVNLANLAFVALVRDDAPRAYELFAEALRRSHAIGAVEWAVVALTGLAGAEHALGRPEVAARTLGVSDRMRSEIGAQLEAYPRRVSEATRVRARETLGEAAFRTAVASGRDDSVADVLGRLGSVDAGA